jgi:putative serine protease PepD
MDNDSLPWWAKNDDQPKVETVPENVSENVSDVPAERVSHRQPRTPRIGISLALSMALLAGALGGGIGFFASRIFDDGPHRPDDGLVVPRNNAMLTTTQSSVSRSDGSVAAVAAKVLPSVVSISTRSNSGAGTGSGFIIRPDGYILTNNHVVSDAANNQGKITVSLNNDQQYSAKIVGRDPSYDLAVIKISASGLPALSLGNSDEAVVGDQVIAIGSPLGLKGTVTTGVISAKNRPVTAGGNADGESAFINALQTDAAINPGNSGGPLVNASGAVIGVNSAIASLGSSFGGQSGSIGLGFAIPINQAKRTAEQLIATGKSSHPILGISLDMNFAGPGAVIPNTRRSIIAAGPADKAGLQSGDVITYLDGEKIDNADELIVAIRSHAPGDKVEITFTRNGKSLKTSAILVAAPEN